MQGSLLSVKSRSTRFALLFSILLALALFVVAALPPTSSATQDNAQSDNSKKRSRPEFVPGEALVRYRSEQLARQRTFEQLVSKDGHRLSIQIERFDGSNIVPGLRIARVDVTDTMAAIEALKAQPDVLYAEPNYILHLDANPNDPRFTSNELYGLLKIGAPTAWDTIKGSTDTVQPGFGNPRIVVGVIDEGIDIVHQDLAANIWTNPGEGAVADGVDNDGNGFIDDIHGYDFALNSGTITPQSHGTHVAGTIGAVGNNATGVVGVNWSVGLMSLKFIDGFQADTVDAIRACNYAKTMRDLWVSSSGTQGANLRVLNNSYGDDQFTQSFLDTINALNSSGILFVASAGNVGGFSTQADNDLVPHYPSSYAAPNVIGVASTGQTDNLASDSHYGAASVHMGAPGIGILSTTPGNTYSFSSGTSMATPHVAGAAALLLAKNPNLTIQQLKSLLIYNGDQAASLSGKTLTGRRLNVANSVAALAENDVTPPGTVTGLHVNSQSGRSFNIGWTASGDNGASGQASLYAVSFTDGSSGAVIFLKNVIPVASGVGQAIDVKLPYRHVGGTITVREFDNAGNEGVPATLAISVPPVEGDPYVTSLGVPVALSTGGIALATDCDDCLKTQALPFTFPFFGENFNSVKVSSNGVVYFSTPPATDSTSSLVALSQLKMIAGLWDDLRTDVNVGDDIYFVTPDSTRVIFRWQTVTFGNGTPATELPVTFEIELRSNGTILTRYGSGGQSPDADILSRVVGISGGEPDTYVIPSHTAQGTVIDLTNAQEVTYLPRSLSPQLSVVLSNPGIGVNITVSPTDDNGLGNGTTPFARHYTGAPIVSLTAPATANGCTFQKWQRDGVDWAATQATNVTMDTSHTMTPVYTATLTVASSNPGSGLSITVTPNDNGGLGGGTTQFQRTYNINSTVSLTAPATALGNLFQKWQRDGVDWSATPAATVSMDAPHVMTAVYVPANVLTVASSNPASGVSVVVSPSDAGGQGNGTTQFTRNYLPGSTVILTAPTTAGGNNFRKWQRDGVDVSTNPATSVTMDAAHTMTAVYVTPRTLTVASTNPTSGISITVSPNDINSLGNGSTQFSRTYDTSTLVNLTAPATAAGNNFVKWQRDGVDLTSNLVTSVTMDANHTMTAIYATPRTLTVASANPGSGVNVTVTPNDNNSAGNGTTQFTRIYNEGSVVNLTAPASAGGNVFLKWQRDGIDFSVTAATSVTIDSNRTMTAVYGPRTLTVASILPSSGVGITVSPNDIAGLGNGTTQFTRTYGDGTVVSLTAPASVSGNPFKLWQRDGVDWADTQATTVTMDGNHTMTAIYNNSVQFSLPQYNTFEAETPACSNPACGASVVVTVTRGGSTASPASVDYTTSDDVATQKGDYIISAGRLNFAVGETSKTFIVFIVDDVYQEGTEAFKVVLSNPVGTDLGVRTTANVAIFDNDLSPGTTNPLDNADARFYVREHYVDFLNREPDAGGLGFWTDQITSCGADNACKELRRINVSAAFFLSIEFQETGYLVERLYKSSYGDATGTSTFNGAHTLPVPMVRYGEFMADSQEISRGVVIGQPGADQLLENNKVAFINSFVQRPRFTTAFPPAMTPAAFVDALNANAGNPLSAAERNQLVADLTGGQKTRAQVLRAVAEDSDLNNAEKNKAFVLMQYFGYLRRDPNVGTGPNPDTDYTGYDFWLTKLLQFNGNFVNAEMVKAFIVSGEYRGRFAP